MPQPKKPTKQQAHKALEAQAPMTSPVQRTAKRRTLNQAGVGFDDSLNFFKAAEWFESDEDEFSLPFDILSARESTKGQFGPKVIFKLKDLSTDEISLVSLPADDKRKAFVAAFQSDTSPIGPCWFVRFDSGKAQAYFDIQMAVDAEIPF